MSLYLDTKLFLRVLIGVTAQRSQYLINNMIDLQELTFQIRSMSTRSALYKVLKAELGARGWWKNKARWKPPKGTKVGVIKAPGKNH